MSSPAGCPGGPKPGNDRDDTHVHPLCAGDDIRSDPGDCLRFLCCNVDGFRSKHYIQDFEEFCDACLSNGVDFAGVTEPKIDFSKGHIKSEFKRAAIKMNRTTKLGMTSSILASKGVYKPGGVMSLAFKKGCARQTSIELDESGMGRFIISKMAGNGTNGLAVVVVYQTCKSNMKGKTSTKRQQDLILAMDDHDIRDPRKALWIDLGTALTTLRLNHFHIILMGDFNTSIYDGQNGDFVKVLNDNDLVDPLVERNTEAARTPTHRRGSSRIDYILVSNSIVDAVKHYGILPFDTLIQTDHRPIFCDIHMKEIFGSTDGPSPTIGRGIRSSNPIQCLKFIYEFDRIMLGRGIHRRCASMLQKVEKEGPSNEASRLMRTADFDLRSAMLCSERSAGRHYRAPWSPKLSKAYATVKLWRIYTRYSNVDSYRTILEDLAAKIGWPSSPSLDVTEAYRELRKANRDLKKIRSVAAEARSSSLEIDLATASADGDKKRAIQLRAIIRCEALKISHAKLKTATKDYTAGGLSAVEILNDDGTKRTITDPSEMIPLLLTDGRRHFAQADGTPFTRKPLVDLQYTACCAHATAILNGESTFVKETIGPDGKPHRPIEDDDVADYISHARFANISLDNKLIDCTLTAEQIRLGFMHWKEDTSTSPDGDHLGIYKALGKKYSDSDVVSVSKSLSYTPRSIETIQEEAWASIRAIMVMGANFGLTIPRWEKAVCVLIEKAPGNMLLQKLRRIFIMASDYSLLMSELIGRPLIWHAEEHQMLHKDLWGGRKDRSSPDASYAKELTAEVSRLTHTSLATMDNDAKSCYDRVVMVAAYIMLRRAGLPPKTTEWIAKVQRNLKHFPKTAYGVSNEYFGTTDGHGVEKHGGGQGNPLMGALWLFDSNFLFEQMDRLAHGLRVTNPDTSLIHERKQDAIIDDVTQFYNVFEQEYAGETPAIYDIAKGLEIDVRHWAKQLWITGGALEPSKCFWSMLSWTSGQDNRPVALTKAQIEDAGGRIVITNHDTKKEDVIELCDPDDARRTLGAFKSMSGCCARQIEVSKDKSRAFAQQIHRTNLSKEEARMAAEGILLPKLGFCLATATLTEPEANDVHRQGLTACIQAAGFARTTAKAIIHGPFDLGGASFGGLYATQTWGQLDLFVHHLRRDGPMAILSRIVLDWTQLVSGAEFPLLEKVEGDFPYMRTNLILSLRKGLRRCDARLRIYNAPKYEKLRENDEYIMNIATATFKDRAHLRDINICRMYLGVITLADCATPDGLSVDRACYTCSKSRFQKSRLRWPLLPEPCPRQKTLWRKMWANSVLQEEEVNGHGNRHYATAGRYMLLFSQPLGKWIERPLTRQFFPRMACGSLSYIFEETGYREVRSIEIIETHNVPVGAYPWGVEENDDCTKATQNQRDRIRAKASPFPKCSSFRYATTPEAPILWHTEFAGRFRQKIDPLPHLPNILMCVSDGGAKGTNGSFGCVIAGEDGTIYFEANDRVPGHDPKSFRAEAFGMLVGACKCAAIYNDRPGTDFQFWSDNSSLVKVMNQFKKVPTQPLRRNSSEFDVVTSIREIIRPFLAQASFHWVKGHRDDVTEVFKIEEKLNIHSDGLATAAMEADDSPFCIVPILPSAQALVDVRGRTVTRYVRRAILDANHWKDLKQMVMARHQWTEDEFVLADWPALGGAMKGFSQAARTTVVKICNKQLPIGAIMIHRAPKLEDGLCPFCNLKETQEHLFICTDNKGRGIAFRELNEDLKKCDTAEHIQNAIFSLMFPERAVHIGAKECHIRNMITTLGVDAMWRGKFPTSISLDQRMHT